MGTSDPHDLPVFPLKSRMAEIMQIAFGIVLMLTYPIISIITREYIESVIIQCQSGSPKNTNIEAESPEKEEEREVSNTTSAIITLVLMATIIPFIFCGSAAWLAEHLLDIIGGLASGSLGFVFPSILFWKVFGWKDESGERSCKDRVLPMAILVFGGLAVVFCPLLSILEMCGCKLHS